MGDSARRARSWTGAGADAVTITFLIAGAIVVLASLAGLAWGVPTHMDAPGSASDR